MSRVRQHAVGGLPPEPPAEKPTPTKEQILTVLDTGPQPVATKHQALLACARLYGLQEGRMTAAQGLSWARSVINYPAAENLFDKMILDFLIVGREAWAWKEAGLELSGTQAGAVYYATARRAVAVDDKKATVRDEEVWRQAGELASSMLVTRHREEYERLRGQAYDSLRKGEAQG
ncbi:hypothetical protein [Streptomyces sp. NPDC059278]|uniref:hypothetical protein n=1 Tax=Streptomyces sp. NPDC059278 TaxID=3346801 RepID=UPI00367E9752